VLNLLFFLFSLAILFFVVRFRIHVHVVYQGSSRDYSRPRPKSGRSTPRLQYSSDAGSPATRPESFSGRRAEADRQPVARLTSAPTAMTPPVQFFDVQSALVNLGAPKAKARATAQRVCQQHPGAGFDQLVRIAIQEVQAA